MTYQSNDTTVQGIIERGLSKGYEEPEYQTTIGCRGIDLGTLTSQYLKTYITVAEIFSNRV